jgi:hypothetical protein
VSNSLSGENIALGLLVISESGSWFRISERKLELAKRIYPDSGKLVDFSITQFQKVFHEDLQISSQQKLVNHQFLSQEYIKRLSVYNNGLLQFTAPQAFDMVFQEADFNNFFLKFIGTEQKNNSKVKKRSQLKSLVQKNFYQPLQGKIDVDYTLKRGQLPSLYFDFHFDGVGVNGGMYAVKSIDLNAQSSIAHVKNEISGFESVIERLNQFAEKKKLKEDPQYFLVFEEYKGSSASLSELSDMLKQNNMPQFKVKHSNDLEQIADRILKNKVGKFSAVLYDEETV